jgi:hypothetical protein
MAKKTYTNAQKSKVKGDRKNSGNPSTTRNGGIRILRVKKGDSLKTIYAKVRRAFTAADLQKYTEIEEGIPFDQIIAEAEAIHREEMKKRRKKKK